MKSKTWTIYLILIVITSLAVFLIFRTGQSQAQKVTAKDLYKKSCASCHGEDGKGVEKMAKMLKVTIRDVTKLTMTPELAKEWDKVTKEGKGKMPAYKAKLKPAEIDSILAYMQTMTVKPTKSETAEAKDTTKVSKDTTKVK